MRARPRVTSTTTNSTPISALIVSFRRHLEAENKGARTIQTYMEGLRLFSEFLERNGHPCTIGAVRRADIESFIADLLERFKAATALNRFRALRVFFKWAVEDDEIDENPMANMKPPIVPEEPPAVITDQQLAALLQTCNGRDFDARRDTAVIRLLIDTGMRRAELAGLTMEDLDLENNECWVFGKGRRKRRCPFGAKAAKALDRYVRARAGHKHAGLPNLWVGVRGPVTDSGIYQMLQDRAATAGIGHIHTHQFRHTFAHNWLSQGGTEGNLMRLAGWKSRSMLERYGASAADDRARDAFRQMSIGDRI